MAVLMKVAGVKNACTTLSDLTYVCCKYVVQMQGFRVLGVGVEN